CLQRLTTQSDSLLIRQALQAAESDAGETVDWLLIAKTELYRRKRARTLADLVRAKGVLADNGFCRDGGDLDVALRSEEGTRGVEVALRRIKQHAIASHVM